MANENIRNLEVIQSNTKCWKVIFPFDISGCILFFTVKSNPKDSDDNAVILKTVDVPYNSDSVAGNGYINLLSEDTNIPIGAYYYDIKFQRNESAGDVLQRHTIATGLFRVNITITQRTM